MPVMKDVKCIFYQKVANFTIYDISKLTVLLHKCSALELCLTVYYMDIRDIRDPTLRTKQVSQSRYNMLDCGFNLHPI